MMAASTSAPPATAFIRSKPRRRAASLTARVPSAVAPASPVAPRVSAATMPPGDSGHFQPPQDGVGECRGRVIVVFEEEGRLTQFRFDQQRSVRARYQIDPGVEQRFVPGDMGQY